MRYINPWFCGGERFHGSVERVVEILKRRGYEVEVGTPLPDYDDDEPTLEEEDLGIAIEAAEREAAPLTKMIQ